MTLQPIKSQQTLPGIASLALPLPLPSLPPPSPAAHCSSSRLAATLHADKHAPRKWVLAPASAIIAGSDSVIHAATSSLGAQAQRVVLQPQP